MQLDELDLLEIRTLLQQLKEAMQEDCAQSPDCPPEVTDLIETVERLDKELKNKKSQQLISDFLKVLAFIEAMNETDSDDEDFDFEDEETDED